MITHALPRRLLRAVAVALAATLALSATVVASTASALDRPDELSTPLPALVDDDGAVQLDWPAAESDQVAVELPFRAATFAESDAAVLGTDAGFELVLEPVAVIDARGVTPDVGQLELVVTAVEGPGTLLVVDGGAQDATLPVEDDAEPGHSSSSETGVPVAPGDVTSVSWKVSELGDYDATFVLRRVSPQGTQVLVEEELSFVAVEVPDAPDDDAADEQVPDDPSSGEPDAADQGADDVEELAADDIEELAADDIEELVVDEDDELVVDEDEAVAGDDADAGSPDTTELFALQSENSSDDVAEAQTLSSSQAQEDGRLVLDVGHVDAFDVSLDGSDLVLGLKDDTFLHDDQIVYRSPDEVLFQALPQSATEVPSGEDFAFLGDPGDTVYLLPLTQDASLLWPGWSTERISSSAVDGPVQLSITSLQGPGELKLFTSGTFGGNEVLVDSEDGLPDSWSVNVPAHVHANWAFTETGRYTMTVRADATRADGADVSAEQTYLWHVGDLDDQGPSGGNGGGGHGDGDGGDGGGDGDGGPDGGDGGGATGDGPGAGPGADGPNGTVPGAGGDGAGVGGDGSGPDSLARTGVDTGPLVALSLLLLALGVVVLRRTARTSATSSA